MPVGPSILWALKARRSTPRAATSVGRWGTDWQASATTSAPAAWAAAARSATGFRVPSTLDMQVTASSLAPSRTWSRSSRTRRPSSSMGSQRSSMPRSAASMCHGTMLAWCSISVSTTTSPRPRWVRPQAVGHQVECLGGVLGERDLAGGDGCADEPAHVGAGRLEAPGGLLGDGVHAAVDIGMCGLVVLAHGVEHGGRALRRRGRVQVGDGPAVDHPGQEGEVLGQRGGVEGRLGGGHLGRGGQLRHASYPSDSRRAPSSGPPSSTMTPSTSRWTRSASSSSSMRW